MSDRILYTAPGLNEPSGGARVLFKHVELLRDAGYDAVIWDPQDRTPLDWFATTAPVIQADTLELDETDILVMPEVFIAEDYDPAPGCRKVIYNQGHFLTFNTASMARYPTWDPLPTMWVSSQASFDVMTRLAQALPVESVDLIPHSIDTDIFRPPVEREQKIAWMPQKRPDEAQLLHALFTADPRFGNTILTEIRRMSQQQTAEELGSAAVFIALGHREGFGMPIAEALASGCAVVGYPAGGGAELFRAPGTYSIRESDAVAIVEKVADLMVNPPSEEERRSYRDWVIQHYSITGQQRCLVQAVEVERKKSSQAGIATHPFLSVKHFRNADTTIKQ